MTTPDNPGYPQPEILVVDGDCDHEDVETVVADHDQWEAWGCFRCRKCGAVGGFSGAKVYWAERGEP